MNKTLLIGRISADPELRFTGSNVPFCGLSLATNEDYKDKNGDKVEKTEWHNLVFFDGLAKVVAQYLKKGSKIYVEGKLQTRKWQDKEGKDRLTTEVVVQEMEMLGTPSQGQSQATDNGQSVAAGGKSYLPPRASCLGIDPDDRPF